MSIPGSAGGLGAYSLRPTLPGTGSAIGVTQPISSPFLLNAAGGAGAANTATGAAGAGKLTQAELARLQKLLVALVQARDGATQARPGGAQGISNEQLKALAALASAGGTGAAAGTGRKVAISGGTAADRQKLDAAITKLGSMQSGNAIARELRTQGATFVIDDDKVFDAAGYGGIKAFYNEADNEIHVRASTVRDPNPTMLIHDIAHEGTHFMDAHSDRKQAYLQRRSVLIAQLGGAGSPAAERAASQLLFEEELITEKNAHYNGAIVLKELGIKPEQMKPSATKTALAAVTTGGDLDAILKKIWAGLLVSKTYNPDGREAAYQSYDKL